MLGILIDIDAQCRGCGKNQESLFYAGQLVREWLAREDYDRIRCLELLIVKGWANKDVAKYLSITEQAVASYKFQTIARLKEMARRAGLSLDELAGD